MRVRHWKWPPFPFYNIPPSTCLWFIVLSTTLFIRLPGAEASPVAGDLPAKFIVIAILYKCPCIIGIKFTGSQVCLWTHFLYCFWNILHHKVSSVIMEDVREGRGMVGSEWGREGGSCGRERGIEDRLLIILFILVYITVGLFIFKYISLPFLFNCPTQCHLVSGFVWRSLWWVPLVIMVGGSFNLPIFPPATIHVKSLHDCMWCICTPWITVH